MKKQIGDITERMLKNAGKLAPEKQQELAKKLGIEISEKGISIPDVLFTAFSPKVLGKFVGGLFLVVIGDLVYESLAKKVIEKYPKHESKVKKTLFVVRYLDVFIRPSWLKFGLFAAGNASKFKEGFDQGCTKANNFGQYLKEETQKYFQTESKDEEIPEEEKEDD